MKTIVTILFIILSFTAKAQKVESISFNLYTDSLKKGVHNYINVDGKLSNGSYLPLMSDELLFTSSAGKWEGNSVIIDSAYRKDSIVISVALKSNPALVKNITIYMKRNLTEEPLKTEAEIFEAMRNGRKKH